VLSVGGFNPRFEPPSDFPPLERIALTLGPGNPRIRWAGYFAVTTNTVQVGARVEVYAAAGAMLAAVSLLACWVPALRAASVQPAEALRQD
jgi:ABC-type lipoprotein release transport system permease subunit